MSDFNWIPSNKIEEETQYVTLVTEFENGVTQRRSKRSQPDKIWRLPFINIPKATAQEIQSFFNGKKGRAESFTWTNPIDNIEYTVTFDQDELNLKRINENVYRLEIRLKKEI